VCVVLAVVSVGAVGFGLFDNLIQSIPGQAEPATAPPTEGQRRVVEADPPASSATQTTTTVALEPHRAVYRDGKLFLRGTVPSEEISSAFETKAAEVIGADNVINNYVIDPRAPEPTDGRVIVGERFLFAFDSAEIDPQFHDLLDLGVAVMELNPQATMRIIGHTDSTGTEIYNESLSLARAVAVAAYLTDNNIDPARLDVEGRGEGQPVADNTTAQGRSLNRRIEIQLLDLLS